METRPKNNELFLQWFFSPTFTSNEVTIFKIFNHRFISVAEFSSSQIERLYFEQFSGYKEYKNLKKKKLDRKNHFLRCWPCPKIILFKPTSMTMPVNILKKKLLPCYVLLETMLSSWMIFMINEQKNPWTMEKLILL